MTAEIAVMNREAISLAADSAVTMMFEGGPKVFPSANKIFALSRHEPVAAMIYGNAGLMGVPWEPAIKMFRRELGHTSYPHIQKYSDELLRFLREHRKLFPEKESEPFHFLHVLAYFNLILSSAFREWEAKSAGTQTAPPVPPDVIEKHIVRHLDRLKTLPQLPSIGKEEVAKLRTKFRPLIKRVVSQAFSAYKLGPKATQALLDIGVFCTVKCPPGIDWPLASGLVVGGFGRNDFFPSLRSFAIHGIFGGHLHYRTEPPADVGINNPAWVIPFAQKEMVYAFMEGVDPRYQKKIESDMLDILKKYPKTVIDSAKFLDVKSKGNLNALFQTVASQFLDDYRKELSRYRQKNFAQRVIQLVGVLPKGELATLAESMVSLTSMRHKISPETETVGGPIDVAVISKGDGLIWVKRKHYFDPALNSQFFHNYNLG